MLLMHRCHRPMMVCCVRCDDRLRSSERFGWRKHGDGGCGGHERGIPMGRLGVYTIVVFSSIVPRRPS